MVTEHAVCALPDDHRDWRHLAIRVQQRSNSGRWVLNHSGFFLTPDGLWSPTIQDAIEFDEQGALAQAAEWAPLVTMPDGSIAADLLNR